MRSTRSLQHNKRMLILQGILSGLFGLIVLIVGETYLSGRGGVSFVVVILRLTVLAIELFSLLCFLQSRDIVPMFCKICRRIWMVCATLVILSFVIIEILVFLGDKSDFSNPTQAEAQYMIVLGAGIKGHTPSLSLQSRLDTAVAFLKERPDVICVVSGGQGKGESITEAQAMYNYLVTKGIGSERIIKEEASVNTAQNVSNSIKLLKDSGFDAVGKNIIVCSNGYHLFRARFLLNREGANPLALDAPEPLDYLTVIGYIREYFSVLFMWRRA